MSGNVEQLCALAQDLIENISSVILGKREIVIKTVAAVLAEGNVLFEDVPGVGKTMLCRALAGSISGNFSRVQCTPDLLPSDLLGTTIYEKRTESFKFHPGPVFSNVLLADEINRAAPKMQSALLECMEEHQVSTGGKTYRLPEPFIVIATQNPIEYEGTFPLPEAQLDRFTMRLSLGYPDKDSELRMLKEQLEQHPIGKMKPICDTGVILKAIHAVRRLHISDALMAYIVGITTATRNESSILLGASPRASQALCRAAQAMAAIDGRDYVLPDDIQAVTFEVLAHRMIWQGGSGDRGASERQQEAINSLLRKVPVP